jgi:hypothetical protein
MKENNKGVLLDLLMGAAISAAAYILIWLVSVGRYPSAVQALVYFVVLAVFIFFTVRFLRRGHSPAGIIMLIAVSPAILVLLLWGACSLVMLPF